MQEGAWHNPQPSTHGPEPCLAGLLGLDGSSYPYHRQDCDAPMLQHRIVDPTGWSSTPKHRYEETTWDEMFGVTTDGEKDKKPSAMLNLCMAKWYVEQVLELLRKPGQYRAGTGGTSSIEWSAWGREKEEWKRVGRPACTAESGWGRMGLTQTPPMSAPRVVPRQRFPHREPLNPYGLCLGRVPSLTLVSFALEIISRLIVSPTAVVAALWYLKGLGLHPGDPKGQELREFLCTYSGVTPEAVEQRVLMLGLIMAGKWLDDNSFLTKSW
jgi:hypothetical protein